MSALEKVSLPDERAVEIAASRLLHFCREEYDYYDGLPSTHPDRIEPVDILATVSMNSYITNAAQVRRIHRGMATNCAPLLPLIPAEAMLLGNTPQILADLESLLHAAIQCSGVLIPVATKVLHRKRPHLIPMLDNVVLGYYLRLNARHDLLGRTQDKRKAASAAMTVLEFFRQNLEANLRQLETIRAVLAREGFDLSLVRIFEILVWITVEERGYYRS